MASLVVLTSSPGAADDGYDIRLGPLRFVTPADTVSEAIGDGLEVVGAALTAAERKPRPLKLKLPVRGYQLDFDPKQSGLRLRRQVRQVIDNPDWRLQGFYFVWDADPDLDGWLLIGGAELGETDPGISFGEYELDFSDVYLVGRPGTHRPGRRAAIMDRRTGLAPRDTRRLLYSTDFSSQSLPTEPLILPGDLVDLVSSGNRPVESTTLGPLRGARHLWRTATGQDAEIVSYRPDETLLPDRTSYLDLDDLGSVRVWDLSNATPYPPDPTGYTTERDTDPNLFYGWEQVLGDVLTPDQPLAIENGACRLIWLGAAANKGLAVEYWDDTAKHFLRAGRVLHALNVREQRVVELTPERAVIEWRAGRYGMRAILQRGWWGPRLESYDDGGETARLEFAPDTEGSGAVHITPQVPTWVRALRAVGRVANPVLNPGFEHDTVGSAPAQWTNVLGTGVSGEAFATSESWAATGARSLHVKALHPANTTSLNCDARLDSPACRIPVAPGQIWTARAVLNIITAAPQGFKVLFDWYKEDNATRISSPASAAMFIGETGVKTLVATSAPAPPEATFLGLIFRAESNISGGSYEFYIDSVIAALGTVSPIFASGDSSGYEWSGTPGNSTTLLTMPTLNWASGSTDEVVDASITVIAGDAVAFRRTRVLVAQLGCAPGPTAEDLASLSLIDARPVPVLIGRS